MELPVVRHRPRILEVYAHRQRLNAMELIWTDVEWQYRRKMNRNHISPCNICVVPNSKPTTTLLPLVFYDFEQVISNFRGLYL